jgi:hypothetical protein
MEFCDADACPTCTLTEGTPACLRQKAKFCRWLASRVSGEAIKCALEKMSLDLIEEASAQEREQILKVAG